jgi:DNA ligase-associated metallophosphoesterase
VLLPLLAVGLTGACSAQLARKQASNAPIVDLRMFDIRKSRGVIPLKGTQAKDKVWFLPMGPLTPSQVLVAENVLLDGRLVLFHQGQKWLAVADLHFGYELSQRAAGNLFPLWGMQTIEARLRELLDDYAPAQLILLGDLVHDRTAEGELFQLVERLRKSCEIVLIGGNHDRRLNHPLVESWQSDGFYFHHGHCASERRDCIQIIGHHHPAAVIRDGAGLRLKLPAFVQQKNCWIMPAFSPWAAGVEWPADKDSRTWLCSPKRILCLDNSPAFSTLG